MVIDKLEESRLEKQRKRYAFIKSINDILGQSIFDHELVVGNAKAIGHIKRCTHINHIIVFLDKLYEKKHKKKLNLPSNKNGRMYYQHHKFTDRRLNKQIAATPLHQVRQASQILSATRGSE